VPIRWSAAEVRQAMDEAAFQVSLAEPFLAEAVARIEAARRIANLPQYIDERLVTLLTKMRRLASVKHAIEAVREAIPGRAIEAQHARIRHGSQQQLM